MKNILIMSSKQAINNYCTCILCTESSFGKINKVVKENKCAICNQTAKKFFVNNINDKATSSCSNEACINMAILSIL